ncbi:RNA polymerase sigma-I factor [Acetivibrio clariflavus]|uniref:RNA polymerase sigma factor SigI n=1 Tax=Acetivibrio clariflavus (strain DSM 19732 / NBRC 101661 / EBR45) TaxID=720554 RepID=G8M342_ACECE|nr:RNA polymerase sigma-I factor [Acetivibrio clariflavus]AEV69351.1 RNA polymerase sigma-I factor [Acetivibrio clariflavus DSM 19732]
MINLKLRSMRKQEADSFLDIIQKIKDGDVLLRNKFINDYKPFILKCVYKLVGKKENLVQSDEYSIALMAFNEALDSYDADKNIKFISFAKEIIRRRIIDYIRSTKKNNMVIPFSYFTENDNNFEEEYLCDTSSDYCSYYDAKEEIKNLEQKMNEYNMTIEELINSSPKHQDTRLICLNVAKIITEDEMLFKKFREKKTLPYNELREHVNLCRRTLEKNRKFIIAMVLILKSDLDVLKKYIFDTIGR